MPDIDNQAAFDLLAAHYNRMTGHADRIVREEALWSQWVAEWAPGLVLDAGCGGGTTMIALERDGRKTWGIDSSPEMIELAAANGRDAGLALRLVESCLHEADNRLSEAGAGTRFAAVVCLGNTLASIGLWDELVESLAALRRASASGACLIVQVLNFELFFSGQRRLITARQAGDWRYTRFAEPVDDRFLRFHVVAQKDDLETVIQSATWRGWRSEELQEAIGEAGWQSVVPYGGLDRRDFAMSESGDLVVVATNFA